MSTARKTPAAFAPKIQERARVNPIRHIQLFDPHVFDKMRIDVIGLGAVGSRLAIEIGRLGVRNLHIWDDDKVDEHNIANQHYILSDVGKFKAKALADHIRSTTGLEASTHITRVDDEPVMLGKVVFLAVDTMAARRAIFKSSLHLKLTTDLVVETRMGAEELRVYGFNPRDRQSVAAWERTLSDDKKTVESVCNTRTTVGATAGIVACLAVHRFLQWYRREIVKDPKHTLDPPLEQVMMLRPLITTSNRCEDCS